MPAAPLTSTGRASRPSCANVSAWRGDRRGAADHRARLAVGAAVGAQHDVGVEHGDAARSKSPSRAAARNASTTSRWAARSASGAGVAPCTRRRARLASWRAASGERSTIGAISSNGTANMSCRTNASRSAGVSVSSTTSSARPTESASSASCSGSVPSSRSTIGSGMCTSSGSSRRVRRERSMFRHTRATTVVSQPPRFSIASASARLSRSQASWTASSASLSEPSIR